MSGWGDPMGGMLAYRAEKAADWLSRMHTSRMHTRWWKCCHLIADADEVNP